VIGFLKSRRAFSRLIASEADDLLRDHGKDAYEKCRERIREARRHKDTRLEHYFSKVAVALAQRTEKPIGEDIAALDRGQPHT
jgi:hypothetical protein